MCSVNIFTLVREHTFIFIFPHDLYGKFFIQEIMEISRDEFYNLPQWKQDKIKQQVGLF